MGKIQNVIYFIAVMSLCMGCVPDKAAETFEMDGSWEVVSATRRGKPTTTVNGAVFNFDSVKKSMSTDILGSLASSPYFFEKGVIHQEIPMIKYRTQILTDTSLILNSVIEDMRFSFVLNRKDETQNE